MNGIIGFKTLRQQREWLDDRLNNKLRGIILSMAHISYYVFGKPLILTCIFRKPKEQYLIYKDNPNFKIKPWQSVHEFWRGGDIRTFDYTDLQIEILLNIANCIQYDPNRPEKKTAKYHDLGTGTHIHTQVL